MLDAIAPTTLFAITSLEPCLSMNFLGLGVSVLAVATSFAN